MNFKKSTGNLWGWQNPGVDNGGREMKCCACEKEIEGQGKLISCDGDFVCDDACHDAFHREMDAVCAMSDKQFESWMMGADIAQ